MKCVSILEKEERKRKNRITSKRKVGKIMKEYVKVKELLKEVDEMSKRGTLLARGGVTQEDLAMQIKGLIVHVASKEETE